MTLSHALRRWAARGGTATVAAIALAGGMQAAAGGAQAAAAGPPAPANPYSPAYHHPYRQGVIPTRSRLARMRTWARNHPAAAASPNDPNYGGGIDGIGVTTGQEKVYLVFYGSQCGTQSTNASYDVTAPTGTHPDGFNTPSGAFCAWHDWNGDPFVGVTSPYGDIAFTNMPYVTDLGASCGENFVNAGGAGLQDGISIVNGHEYAETITDQNPAGGWTDSTGAENADKCAWITPGTPGGSFDLSTGHGTFAMQTTWGNDGNSGAGTCQASHAIVTNPGNTVTVTNPG